MLVTCKAWSVLQIGKGTWGSFQNTDPALYDSLAFVIHGGTSGVSLTLEVDNGTLPGIKVTAAAGHWERKSIPMSLLATVPFGTFYFDMGGTTPTFSLDDIQLIKNGSSPTPTLTVNPTSLSFGTVIVNTTSSEQTNTITGTNLTPSSGTITVTAPVGYQVSSVSGSGFASSLAVAYSGSSLVSTTVYARFTPTAVQSYSGNITGTGGGATTVNEAVSGTGISTSMSNTLRVCAANPRYFTDNTGKAIYLTGSHTWANFIDQGDVNPPPAFEWNKYLDWLQGTGQNYLRLWIREHFLHTCEIPSPATWYLSPESMYKRSTTSGANDGGNKFNLDSLDSTWFARLRQRCIDAGNQGIYVDITLFDGWSVWNRNAFNVFDYHPYSSNNNVNGVNGDPDGDHNGNVHTVNAAWNNYQFKYIKRLIDEVNDLDNILYEIGNECSMPSASQTDPWIRMMIDTIHAYELRKPKQHPVGYTGDWTIPNSFMTSADNHSEFIAFAAGNNGNAYETDPPAADGSKVVIMDTDHLWGVPDGSGDGSRTWIWKSFTRGLNVNSMDPWNSASYGNFAGTHFDTTQTWWRSFRINLGYANTYARKMNLTVMIPQGSLSSTTYCLANPSAINAEYLIYSPASVGTITVDVSAATDSLNVEWFNPATGVYIFSSKIRGGASRSFTTPFSGDVVLYLHNSSDSLSRRSLSESHRSTVPKEFQLQQNYPNPFNPSTTIAFTLAEDSWVTLKIYDMLGREVATLVNQYRQSGVQNIETFDASRMSSGMYIYRLHAGNNVLTKKLILLK